MNEEEVEWKTEGETQFEEECGDLDPEQVRQGREEEMNCVDLALGMFEVGLQKEATSKAIKVPTTRKWIDRVKKDDDETEFVRCRPCGTRALFAWQECTRTDLNRSRMKWTYMVIGVKKAHLNAKRKEKGWVELRDEIKNIGKYAKLKRWMYGMKKATSQCEDDLAGKLVIDGFQRDRAASTVFCHSSTTCGPLCMATTSCLRPRSRN